MQNKKKNIENQKCPLCGKMSTEIEKNEEFICGGCFNEKVSSTENGILLFSVDEIHQLKKMTEEELVKLYVKRAISLEH